MSSGYEGFYDAYLFNSTWCLKCMKKSERVDDDPRNVNS